MNNTIFKLNFSNLSQKDDVTKEVAEKYQEEINNLLYEVVRFSRENELTFKVEVFLDGPFGSVDPLLLYLNDYGYLDIRHFKWQSSKCY